MMTCKHVYEHASDYLDGPVSFAERLSLLVHLVICKHCRRYLGQLRLAVGLAARIPPEEEPGDAEIDALVQRLIRQPGPDAPPTDIR